MFNKGKNASVVVILISVVTGGAWGIIHASMNWHRGIYAGMHGNDARQMVGAQMADQLGAVAADLHYTGSLKTHSLDGFGPQERVYKFVSPQGVKYCGIESAAGGDNFTVTIIKDCKL